MNSSFKTFHIFYDSLLFFSKCKNINSIFWKDQEIVCWKKETFDRRFPELVSFMPVLNQFSMQIDNKNIKCVNVNTFVADDNWVFHHTKPFTIFVNILFK